MSKRSPGQKQNTRLAHAGREPGRFHGFVNPPIYRGSTVLFPTAAALEANEQEYTYGRLGTPTVRALEEIWYDHDIKFENLAAGGFRVSVPPSALDRPEGALRRPRRRRNIHN